MDVLFRFDPDEVDLRYLSSRYGDRSGWEEDRLQDSESADLHLLWEGGETGGVGRDAAPATSHACQANLRGANLPTLGALWVGRKVSLSVVVLSQNLGQSLPRVVGGSLNTVWHSEFLVKTRQTNIMRHHQSQCSGRGSNAIKKYLGVQPPDNSSLSSHRVHYTDCDYSERLQ